MKSANQLRRIVIVNGPPLPSVGGIQSFTMAMAREATRLGHQVTIIATTPAGRAPLRGTFEGLPIYRLQSAPAVNGRFPIPFDPFQVATVLSEVFGERDQALIVIQARFYPTSLLFAAAARAFGHRPVVIDHGSAHLTLHSRGADALSAAYEHVTTLALKTLRPRFFGVSKASQAWLRHFGIVNAGIVSNGVDASPRTVVPMSNAGRPAALLYCGRLLPQKGIRELLAAFTLLRERGEMQRLVIAGDGPLQTQVAQFSRANEGVEYLGPVSHEFALQLTAATDIVLCLSTWPEGFPSATLEAGAFGRAIIATQYGSGDVVEDDETGVVLRELSPTRLADAIQALSNDATTRERLGAALQKRVLSAYTWPQVVSRFLKECA